MGDRLAIDMGRKLKGAVPPFFGGDRRPVRSQIPLRYPGRRQVRGWSQTCRRPASSC